MPLELAHIEAADRLWDRLWELKRADRAMAALQGSLPGFDHESTLLKVLALHPIDTSKAHVSLPLARDVSDLLMGMDAGRDGLDLAGHDGFGLVDALAEVAERHGKSSYEGLGFASRFAHHFLDDERFPVLDAWSERALRRLVGDELTEAPGEGRYAAFARCFAGLALRLGVIRRRRLGRWLWLAGQHAAWRATPRTPINRSVRELFLAAPPELAGLELPAEGHPAVGSGPRQGGTAPLPEPPPALPRAPAPSMARRTSYDPGRRAGGTRS